VQTADSVDVAAGAQGQDGHADILLRIPGAFAAEVGERIAVQAQVFD
jgi:hypothetical protein